MEEELSFDDFIGDENYSEYQPRFKLNDTKNRQDIEIKKISPSSLENYGNKINMRYQNGTMIDHLYGYASNQIQNFFEDKNFQIIPLEKRTLSF